MVRVLSTIFAWYVIANAAQATERNARVFSLEDGEEMMVSIGANDVPNLFCYPGPQFNVWRSWEDVTFEVKGSPFVPKVYGASEDDVHGLADALIKSYLLDEKENGTDILSKIEKRASTRMEIFPSMFDLLSECPPIWNQQATSCTKVFSPFGKSCISVSVPKHSKADGKAEVKVKITVAFRKTLPFVMFLGFALMYMSRFFAKSKIVWYCSGISISVMLGIVILTVILCRKTRCCLSRRKCLRIYHASPGKNYQ